MEHECFRDVAWLSMNVLCRQTAISYFSLSQFYQQTCNNEQLRMQTRFGGNMNNNSPMASQQLGEEAALRQMTGFEYAIEEEQQRSSSQPINDNNDQQQVFLVLGRRRQSPTVTYTETIHYILNGTIYCAPRLTSIIHCRLGNGLMELGAAVGLLKAGVEYRPSAGGEYCSVDELLDGDASDAEASAPVDPLLLKCLQQQPQTPTH